MNLRRIRVRRIARMAVLAVVAATAARADDSAAPVGPPTLADPLILLVRDAAVRDALACTPAQHAALDVVLRSHNRLLVAIRDVGLAGAAEAAQDAIAELREQLKPILTTEQKSRLFGLVLQAQGYDALLRSDIVAKLKLTPEQGAELQKISNDFRAGAKELQASRPGRSSDDLQQELKQLQADRHKQIVAVLTDEQEARYGELLGEPFDFSLARSSPADAPEFESIEAWLNSPPLSMNSLRGQVVVVHFFAFGCVNCINNYPWYREWHDAWQGQGVTIIGIHTPETEAETDNEQLRQSLEQHGLKFPVAVDKQKAMWNAWFNGIWPSVYIIDKQGRLRYWWYGELDWQGAGNQAVARRQIEQLLAEPDDVGVRPSR
jgi:peroxiredoxin